jgi:predicted nucleic acid-binding protein
VKNGITFDTGALIALERRGQRARKVLERATELKVRITVPAAVITEWWRSRSDIRERILAGVRVEPLSESIAKVAGEALAAIKGATPIDAIVMASAPSVAMSSTRQTCRIWPSLRATFGQCAC